MAHLSENVLAVIVVINVSQPDRAMSVGLLQVLLKDAISVLQLQCVMLTRHQVESKIQLLAKLQYVLHANNLVRCESCRATIICMCGHIGCSSRNKFT